MNHIWMNKKFLKAKFIKCKFLKLFKLIFKYKRMFLLRLFIFSWKALIDLKLFYIHLKESFHNRHILWKSSFKESIAIFQKGHSKFHMTRLVIILLANFSLVDVNTCRRKFRRYSLSEIPILLFRFNRFFLM